MRLWLSEELGNYGAVPVVPQKVGRTMLSWIYRHVHLGWA